MRKTLLLILILLTLVACSSNRGVTKRGHSIDKKDVEQIKVGVTNKETVLELLDYPSSVYPDDTNKWVYYSYKTKQIMFFRPKVVEQDVIIISFNNADVVSSLDQYDLNDSINVTPNGNRTKTNETKKGFFRDFFSNVGRVTPGF